MAAKDDADIGTTVSTVFHWKPKLASQTSRMPWQTIWTDHSKQTLVKAWWRKSTTSKQKAVYEWQLFSNAPLQVKYKQRAPKFAISLNGTKHPS